MHPLNEPLIRDGKFWLPDDPGRNCFGQLTFDPISGVDLKLFGSLRSFPQSVNDPDVPNGVIHGHLESGKPVSLFGAFRKGHHLTLGTGFPTETYSANLAAIGVHASALEQKLFDSANFAVGGLEVWLERDWYPRRSVARDSLVFSLETQPPRKDTIAKSRQRSIILNRYNSIEDERNGRITVTPKSDLTIESPRPRSIAWYLQQSQMMVSFLSFCVAQLTAVEFVSLGYRSGSNRSTLTEVEILYSRIDNTKIDANKRPLAPASTLADLRQTLKNWADLYWDSESAIGLVHEVQSDHLQHVNVRFLLAVQAAESFHREVYSPLNRTLRLRIDDLVVRVRNVIGYTPKALNETFRSKTVRTRNYYTHFSSKSGKIFDSVEMYWASQRLAVVVIILALNQVGVASSTIRKQLASRDDISRILRAPGVPF